MRSILIYLTLFFLRLEPSEGKNLPLPGMTFRVADHPAFLILPRKRSQPGQLQPWVWYAPTLPGLPGKEEKWMFSQFLERGIAIAGIDRRILWKPERPPALQRTPQRTHAEPWLLTSILPASS